MVMAVRPAKTRRRDRTARRSTCSEQEVWQVQED